jgi:5-methyltetrahydrofolate--homocysteine methyltransferase
MSVANFQELQEAVIEGQNKLTVKLVTQALAEGQPAGDLLNKGLTPAMEEVGQLFERREMFIPEMMLAARAMREGLNVLKPHLQQADVKRVGKAVISTVEGDLHDIGKNLVIIMAEGAGFEVIDLGVDVPPARIVDALRAEKPDVLMLSALITSTLSSMQRTIHAVDEAGLHGRVKILVGGAPVTAGFARQIGADGYAPDAASAARVALQVIGK